MTTEENKDTQTEAAVEASTSKRARKAAAKPAEEAPASATAEPTEAEAPAAPRRAMGGPSSDVKAIAKWVRMSPRKARRVIDLIRNKPVEEARVILNFLPQRAGHTVLKVLESAVANAEHNKGMNRRELKVKAAFADGGPMLKRFQPHAQGRAFPIKKRLSHITVVVGK